MPQYDKNQSISPQQWLCNGLARNERQATEPSTKINHGNDIDVLAN